MNYLIIIILYFFIKTGVHQSGQNSSGYRSRKSHRIKPGNLHWSHPSRGSLLQRTKEPGR